MDIVTIQSFDDNLMQRSWDEINEWNKIRMKEWNDLEQAKALKRHTDWFAEYGKSCYSQPNVSSALEMLKTAKMDLAEAADKFWVSYCNYPFRGEFDVNKGVFGDNRIWENREMLKACYERANNAEEAINKFIYELEHPGKR